jgi:hypothetical protein
MLRWRRLLPRLLLPGSWFLVVCYLDPLAGMQKSIKTRNPQNSKLSLGLFFKSQNIRHLCYQIVLAILSLYFLPIIFFYCVNALHGVNLFNACSIFVMRITLQNMSQGQKAEISMRSHDKGAGKNKKLRVEISR